MISSRDSPVREETMSAQPAIPSATAPAAGGAKTSNWFASNWGLIAAVVAMIVVLVLPTPAGLPVAGHRMLAILLFAVIVWMTEAIDYAVSAIVIAALMAFLLGLAPSVADPKVFLGTSRALSLAFGGFATTGLVLVAAALFLAAAMTQTGLDKRIALNILARVGTETRNVVVGTILVGIVIAFMVPSTTARVACLVPITLGMIAAFGMSRTSTFAAMLMIVTVQTASIWNVGIKTAAAQNMIAIGFIEKAFNQTITWIEWLIAAAPFAMMKAPNSLSISPLITTIARLFLPFSSILWSSFMSDLTVQRGSACRAYAVDSPLSARSAASCR